LTHRSPAWVGNYQGTGQLWRRPPDLTATLTAIGTCSWGPPWTSGTGCAPGPSSHHWPWRT